MTTKPGKKSAKTSKAASQMRAACMAYPETREDFPWGHSAFKVRGKTFVFMSDDGGGFRISVKLNGSQKQALKEKFASPTHYGMGKYGWVSAGFGPNETPPMKLLLQWVEESFREVAPKGLLKRMGLPLPPPKKKAAAAKKVVRTKGVLRVARGEG